MSRTKEQERRFRFLADLGCIHCYLQGIYLEPAIIHHIEDNEDWQLTIPLCVAAHGTDTYSRRPGSVHGSRKNAETRRAWEYEMLEHVNHLLLHPEDLALGWHEAHNI